jgi:hypothetical protein
VRRELLFKQMARDVDGEGLVWTGEPEAATLPGFRVFFDMS